ncbi:hypothetical protein [Chondromyces crocatus]|uniref:Secreted protein n=1 Tax=Chondromyces crocatus TaxID=52 RepID=A0A0K1E8M9_CHOCO|nr:hypothetical protein [Chondromyces crocatus]AKT37042.1 uncharacterized protein CMC5_011680 [Chondromyces crocatus]
MVGASRTLGLALFAAALAGAGMAAAQTEKTLVGPTKPAAPAATVPSEQRVKLQGDSVLEGIPPRQLGRDWVEVVEDVRQQLSAAQQAAAAVPPQEEPAREPSPEAQANPGEPGAPAQVPEPNTTTLHHWRTVRVFAEPVVFRERSTTFGRWDTGVLPGLGVRFPLPPP